MFLDPGKDTLSVHDIYEDQRGMSVEFPQSQARASEVNPTQVLQGTR